MLQLHIRPPGRIGRLLQEDRIARYLADVDRDAQALAREDGVHDGDVLVRQIAGHGEEEDPGEEGGGVRGGWVVRVL